MTTRLKNWVNNDVVWGELMPRRDEAQQFKRDHENLPFEYEMPLGISKTIQ